MNNDNEYMRPPGTYYDILSHPSGRNEAIEVAIVQDHRFAFYYWLKWRNRRSNRKAIKSFNIPSLITIDWHTDLAAPSEGERDELRNLNLGSYRTVALFCWDGLHPHNDGHILSAAYLNLIRDVYVVCKQVGQPRESFKDETGNLHAIYCFHSIGELAAELESKDYSSIYLDIDLDYFTESTDPDGGGESLRLVEEEIIYETIDPNSALMRWIFNRMSGMTIATEPDFCGGMSNSNKIYSIVDSALFEPQLLSGSTKWKHL